MEVVKEKRENWKVKVTEKSGTFDVKGNVRRGRMNSKAVQGKQ